MSKADAQRAMREAKYAARNSSGPTRREAAALRDGAPAVPPTTAADTAAGTPPRPARARSAKAVTAAASTATEASSAESGSAADQPAGERCGHTSISGRSCTREAGHPQKSHRYS